jgi:membrane associated rhomboid family serine protease
VLTTRIVSFRQAVFLAATFTLLLWLVYLVDTLLLPASVKPGIYPRTPVGLIGIVLAPLVHGSFGHLVSNTLPVFLLGAGMIYLYPRSSQLSLPFLYLAPGIGVWLFAREAYHIGASGLSYGMMFFLLVIGMLRKDRASVAFSMVVLFLYGGMLVGLLPDNSGISFEYHLFGALTGAACAFILRNRDPLPTVENYSWEDESDFEEEFDNVDDTDFRG